MPPTTSHGMSADKQIFGSSNYDDGGRQSGRRERELTRIESAARSKKNPSGYKESTGGSRLEQSLSSHASSNQLK